MSKRFTYGETIDYNFFDVFEEKKYLGMVQRDSTKIVDRLNELEKENDNCKNDYRELFSNYVALEEENRKLKKRLRKCANNWKQEIVERGKLEEENEQLKQKLENLGLNEKNDMV